MSSNEHKIHIKPKEKSQNVQIFQSQFCNQPLPSKYLKKPFKRSSQISNTQPLNRKNNFDSEERKLHARSGFNIHRKYFAKAQDLSTDKDEPSFNRSIFGRRVNSESKASKTKIESEGSQIQTQKSEGKINFAKKLIEDLKKQAFKMRRSNTRYSPVKPASKSVEFTQKKLMNREKLIKNSMEKLRPQFNINEVKFFSSKKSLGKIMNESKIQTGSNMFKQGKEKSANLEEKITRQIIKGSKPSEQVLNKVLKKIASPLTSYSQFIKAPTETKYEIKLNFLNQYITLAEKQGVLAHIDFSSMKLLESIYLCLIDIFSVLLTSNKGHIGKDFNYEIVKEYAGVYFQTYSKLKTEFILSEILFKGAKRKLSQYFLMQRILFYWIVELCTQQRISDHAADIKKIVTFLKLSEELLASIVNTGSSESVNNPKTIETSDTKIQPTPMVTNVNPKRKETIVNQEKMKSLGIKKPVRQIKTTTSTAKIARQNLILKMGLDKSQTIDSNGRVKPNIETPKNKNSKNAQSVNVQRTQQALPKKQLSPEEIQLNLFEKKKSLQKQLQKVRVQLKKQFDHKKSPRKPIKTQTKLPQQDDEQAFKRVNNFLRKMKKQKIQLMLKKKKSYEKQLNLKMQQENLMYELLMVEQEKLKEKRRMSIEQNIQEQKAMAQIRSKINKRSNSLIQELLSTYKTDRKENTERIQSEMSEEKITEIESHSQAFRPQRKKYEISLFLSQVFKEQAEKRKEEELKMLERKRVQLRHKQYAQKTRAKTKMSVHEPDQGEMEMAS